MTPQQDSAVQQLQRALNRAHAAGLRGGVYESKFRVWPTVGPCPMEVPAHQFFDVIHREGATIFSPMLLDGGAGA
jgi:hypothetical protein